MSTSIFEIIGPIMIGPSSSHTAGMVRIGMMVNRIVNENIQYVHIEFSPKLQTTYSGHRSDAALIGGVIGLSESDIKIRDAIALARYQGIETKVDFLPEGMYPQNTARIIVGCKDGRVVTVVGTSVGGGSIIINSVDDVLLEIVPEAYHVIIWSNNDLNLSGIKGKIQSGKGQKGFVTCLTFSTMPSEVLLSQLHKLKGVMEFKVVHPIIDYGISLPNEKSYQSCLDLCKEAQQSGLTIAELAVKYEASRTGFSEKSIRDRMFQHLTKMKESVLEGEKPNKLLYGLANGRDACLLRKAVNEKKLISGGIVPLAVSRALGVMEYNGSMGIIVAAPTAGSSGIVPGCFITLLEEYRFSDEKIINALFVCGIMGVIMANRKVSFSGSVGGCQGEIGVSSAISAAGIVSLFSNDSAKVVHAMALCLKNLLGLVCDPIAGPVEIPCIKRNAVGVANAFISADMALAGIRSFIPPDEVIDALVDVEKRLPQELKCATVGGLASTCTAKKVREELLKQ
ncbi:MULTISPECIES: L-serine ammonia-lyase, iron-sulfur-dependent, subunit alpha [unclassified Sedimentibacter]|uniref:L-serine ammonia-lyase, iron-sulfur-dependent, subunit alpha n=1 Tax=unclassified Sedimentibacter TaxID=2649220 RepID=UPI0027E13E96|nr:L-serine ammonia-lyase, iron-sulfur-dependent, subunit alpha [Sedimentibacter sp. MB35-C1]WMJ78312.1 L-serine ammonia-lyase, iron-sulfur-dependent, subunit alpha [Sedimentibacter sp. MB35-C1]